MPFFALLKRLSLLGPRDRSGFLRHLEQGGGKEKEQLVALYQAWQHLQEAGQPQAEDLWRVWKGDPPVDKGLMKKAATRLESLLDTYLELLSQGPLYDRLRELAPAALNAVEAHLLASGSPHKEAAQGLLRAFAGLIRTQESISRMDLWEAWQPGRPFDPELLRNRLTTLQNFLASYFAQMDETKVYKWLSLLPARERAELKRYLLVLGDARRTELSRMLELLLTQIERKKPLPRREFFAIWKGEGQPFQDNILNQSCNALLEQVRKFVAFKELANSPADEAALLIRSLERRDSGSIFEQELPAAQERLASLPQDQHNFRRKAELEEALLSHRNAAGRSKKHAVDYKASLFWLEQDFLLNSFRMLAAAVSRDRSLGTTHDLSRLPLLIDMAQHTPVPLPDLVRAYLLVVLMLTEQDSEPYFQQLMENLLRSEKHFAPELARELFKHAINYCASRLRQGRLDYEEVLARLYEQGLHSRLLFRHELIDAGELHNMVVIFCRTGRHTLALAILDESRDRLASLADHAVLGFLEGVIAFWEDRWVEARRKFELTIAEAEDLFMQVESRMYLWESCWMAAELVPEGPAMISPFETEEQRWRMYRTRLNATPQLSSSVDRHAYYLHEFAKATRIKNKPRQCTRWRELQGELAGEREARHLSWLRAQCKKAIAALGCPQ